MCLAFKSSDVLGDEAVFAASEWDNLTESLNLSLVPRPEESWDNAEER